MSNMFYPFGEAAGSNPAQSYPFDLIVNEANPGLILQPTEPNGVYVAFREVGGCSWWALNADYNTDDAQWEQQGTCNAALPAYALEQCASGTVNRYTAVATNTPGDAITWVLVWSLDVAGNMTSTPRNGTNESMIAAAINVTWSAGSPAVMNVREINLTDSSSNSQSLVDNINVNGTPVWQVRKDGTLEVGIIPFARITGFTLPSGVTLNNANFTGTSTFTGPVIMTDGLTVTGGETVDSLHVTANEIIDGNLNVGGTTTLNVLNVTGSINVPAGTIPVTAVTGTNGIAVTNTGTSYNASGAALVETVTSSDSSVTLTRTGQVVDITAGAVAPVIPGSWFINTEFVPAVGTPQSGSISLGPLPGTSADTFRVVYWGVTGFKDAGSSMVFTGTPATNITWDEASVTVFNGQGNATAFMYFGTAKGGTTPTVSWTTTDYVFATPFTATIAAGIQL